MKHEDDPIYLDWLRHAEEDERRYIAYNKPVKESHMPVYIMSFITAFCLLIVTLIQPSLPLAMTVCALGAVAVLVGVGLILLDLEDSR